MEKEFVEPDYSSDTFHVVLEYFAVSLFPLTTALIFWMSSSSVGQVSSMFFVGWMILASIIGYTIADFLSGFVHWAADTYGSEKTPIFGTNFIGPFRWHHIKPTAMCEHSFTGTIGNSCILGIVLQLAVLLPLSFIENNIWLFCTIITINFAAIATVLANLFHKWAHLPKPPKIALVLQKMRIILPPKHHDIHHTSPFDTHYCVTSGWCNRTLQILQFWKRLEKFLSYLGIHRDSSSSVSPQAIIIKREN